MGNSYLALDVGASSIRLFSGSHSDNILELQELSRMEHQAIRGYSGHLEWQMERIIAWIQAELCHIAQRADNYRSIGIDTWGVDYLLLDADKQLIAPPYSYRDERTGGQYSKLAQIIDLQKLYRRTGSQFMEANTICQLLAARSEEEHTLQKAKYFLMVPDYLAFRLCDCLCNEATQASTSQLYSLAKSDWDLELLQTLQIPNAMFQEFTPAATVLAENLSPTLSGLCSGSLKNCRMVQVASHDTASAVMAIPFKENNDEAKLFLSSGTWSVMGYELETAITSPAAYQQNFANELGYEGKILFLRSLAGLWLLQEVRRELAPSASYAQLEQLIREGGASLQSYRFLFPLEHPLFLQPGNMSGKIQQLCHRAGEAIPENIAALVSSIYHSLAMEYRSCYEALQNISGKKANTLHIVGGGSQSTLLNQLCADCLGLPVEAGPIEASAIGNILAQLIADENTNYHSLAEVRVLSRNSFQVQHFLPQDSFDIEPAYKRYKDIKRKLSENYESLESLR